MSTVASKMQMKMRECVVKFWKGQPQSFSLTLRRKIWHTNMLSQVFIVWHHGSSSQPKLQSPKIINATILFIVQSIQVELSSQHRPKLLQRLYLYMVSHQPPLQYVWVHFVGSGLFGSLVWQFSWGNLKFVSKLFNKITQVKLFI